MQFDDDHYMRQALHEAQKAFDEGEVPIGAVVVKEGRIIGRGYNRIEATNDATAHAEVLAIGAASNALEDWRLNECTLFVTLEPCIMCLGASLQSRVDRIVYGASDNIMGALATSDYRDQLTKVYSRFPEVTSGPLREECAEIMKSFFRQIRKKKPAVVDDEAETDSSEASE